MNDKNDNAQHHVVVLGASPKPARYANQAICLLLDKGYKTTPIHPNFKEIEGLSVINDLSDVKDEVDTLTLYVGSERLVPMVDDILALKPKRVIFNPGTEFPELEKKLNELGIETIEGCTLVMLKTGTFE